ncbi:MAG: ABC transporter substrate-binding protein [Anaerolineae bacterium]
MTVWTTRHRATLKSSAQTPNFTLYPRPGTSVFYLGMNLVAPFTDVRVRQAVSMAIDKQRIVDNFYPPGSIAATPVRPARHLRPH